MRDVLESTFIKEMVATISLMYRHGWDERNGGNVSYLLTERELEPYRNLLKETSKEQPLDVEVCSLAGRYVLITGSGVYFKNIEKNPEVGLGIIRINEEGNGYRIVWGLDNHRKPTSEMDSHLLGHQTRLAIDPEHRIIMHTHATNLLAMSFIHELDEKTFSKSLWKMMTECLVVFPDGIGILPWMVCGNDEIGYETAQKMQEYRLVLWAMHGVFASGRDFDEVFGMIETVEKAAEIYLKIHGKKIYNEISDDELKALAESFSVVPKKGFLE